MPENPPSRLSDYYNQHSALSAEEKLAHEVKSFSEPDQLAYQDLVARQEIAMKHLLETLERERPDKVKELTRDIFDQHIREQGIHLKPKYVVTSRESLMRSAKIEATQNIKVTETRRIELAGSRFLEEKIKFSQTVKFRGEFNQKASVHAPGLEMGDGRNGR